jgi:hypothetical protein
MQIVSLIASFKHRFWEEPPSQGKNMNPRREFTLDGLAV